MISVDNMMDIDDILQYTRNMRHLGMNVRCYRMVGLLGLTELKWSINRPYLNRLKVSWRGGVNQLEEWGGL